MASKSKSRKTKKPVRKTAPKGKAKARKKAPAKKTAARKVAPKAAPRPRPNPRGRKSFVRRAAERVMRAVPRLGLKVGGNIYEQGLDKNAANYQPLTPITFLERSAATFPERTAIIHGTRKYSYAEFY